MGGTVSAVNIYTKGQMVRFGTSPASPFYLNGAPIDPTTVVCKIKSPKGVLTTLTYGVDQALVRTDIGVYHTDLVLDSSGEWEYRFEGSGNVQIAAESVVFVEPSEF